MGTGYEITIGLESRFEIVKAVSCQDGVYFFVSVDGEELEGYNNTRFDSESDAIQAIKNGDFDFVIMRDILSNLDYSLWLRKECQ